MIVEPIFIPDELEELEQWVNWYYKWDATRKEWLKIPLQTRPLLSDDPRLCRAAANKTHTWATFDEAMRVLKLHPPLVSEVSPPGDSDSTGNRGLDGIGYVFSESDPFTGIDLDGCINPDTGEIEPWAATIVNELDSYTELSPSGTGLHIITCASLPPRGRKKGPVEMYDTGRFFTITGEVYGSSRGIEERQEAVERLHARVFAKSKSEPKKQTAAPSGAVTLDDSELLEKIRASKQSAKFEALWSGDSSGYGSQSEADSALCSILRFWTGGDAARIDGLFRGSGLMRPKWDEKHSSDGRTYGEMTIQRVLELGGEVYTPKRSSGTNGDNQSGERPQIIVSLSMDAFSGTSQGTL